jgi:phytoene dehydrogenase-like protein
VIRDMRLYEHGLQVVLRKIDNFLPTCGPEHLLAGRHGLTRAEIARHSAADAEAYDLYSADLTSVIRVLQSWLLRAPPNAGGGLSDLLSLLKLGGSLGRQSLEEQRLLFDFFTKSAGEILRRYFRTDIVQALFGFDAVVGNYASPETPGSAYVLLTTCSARRRACPAPGATRSAAWARSPRRWQGRAGERRRDHPRRPVEEIIVERGRAAGAVSGGKAYRAKAVAAGVNPKLLFGQLLPAGAVDPAITTRMAGWKTESATFRMNVALSELPRFTSRPEPGDHLTAGIIMAPSLAYMDRAFLDARRGPWSAEPIVEMLIPSTLDDSLAPSGQHVASLFCQHFPYAVEGGWPARRDEAADHIIAAVDRYAPASPPP